MFRSRSNLGFPRKIVAYYLLFCLVAVGWLAMGMLLTSHTVIDSRTTSASLTRLGRTAAALELEYLCNGEVGFQEVLQSSQWSEGLQNYSVVSLEGIILANAEGKTVGQTAIEPQGSRLRWGNVSGIQYQDANGRTLSEYRVPLIAHKDHFGSLRITVRQLDFWSTLAEIVRVAPAVVLVPLGLIASGGFLLARLASPLAQVDGQLRSIALQRPSNKISLEALPAKDAISIGWNRIVDLFQQDVASEGGYDLRSRLAEVVAVRRQNEIQTALQDLPEGIAVTDVEGRITFANRAIAALIGSETNGDELAGVELEGEIVKAASEHSEDWPEGGLFEDATTRRPMITEISRHCGGDQRTLRIARLPREGETLPGHVWSVRDITQQKLTEQTRDQFIDAATHELRTPLSNIKAYAETLATCEEIEVEEQKEFCNIINSEVTRLARFVDDLLSISSMESGTIGIERKRTIASRLFEEVLAKVQPLMKQKEIEFDIQLPAKMSDMQIDKDKIVAVLVNLLGNAAKYTPAKGCVSLRVKVDEEQLQIAVVDTGVGISTEELPKVFEKFFRSDDPRVQEEVGTGLGLALAREVIRMHGGELTVESQFNQGSTFMATIPLA